jgi:Tfp pilus assembly protein PilN
MKTHAPQRLGVAFSAGALEVAEVIVDNGSGWRVVRSETFLTTAPAPATNGGKAAAAPAAPAWPMEKLKSFQPRRGSLVASVITGLSAADVLCRVITLPTVNEAELGPMVELQLENISPLPPEQVVYGYEVVGKDDKQSDLLVAIARRDIVEQRLEMLREAGFAPDVLDLDALALLAWLRREKALSEKELAELALVVIEADTATLLLMHGGQPQAVSAVPLQGVHGDNPDTRLAAAALLISDELRLAFTAVQSARPDAFWPTVRLLNLAPEKSPGAGIDAGRLCGAMSVQLGMPCSLLTLKNKPSIALGLCLRGGANGHARINLVPPGFLVAKRRAIRMRQLKQLGVIAVIVYLLLIAGGVAMLLYRSAQLGSVQAGLKSLEPALNRAQELRAELQTLRTYVSNESSALECLFEVYKLKPEGAYLTDIVFTDGDQLSLSGVAPKAEVVTEFDTKLQKSPLFPGGTQLAPVTNVKAKEGTVVRFTIQCKMKKSAPPTRREGVRRSR